MSGNPGKYGPYHRVLTRKQTAEMGEIQQREGRICGFSPNWGGAPSVKAYNGSLPSKEQGIEFWTDVTPTFGHSTPFTVYWYQNQPGVVNHPNDMVCIAATVTRRVP